MTYRVGFGFDTHRLRPSRPLIGDRPASGASAWATGWTNYVIRNNSVSDIGGDGIVVQHMETVAQEDG